MYEEQDTVETYEEESSRPFSEIPRLWLQIFQMTEEFFRREAPRASGSNTVLSLLIAVAVPFIVPLIPIMAMMPFKDVTMGAFEETWVIISVNILLHLAGLYLINGVIYVLARVFGGKGDFGTQVYLQSLYTVPIVVVMTVLIETILIVPYFYLAVNSEVVMTVLNVTTIVMPPLAHLALLFFLVYGSLLTKRVLNVVYDKRAATVIPLLLLIILTLFLCTAVWAVMGPTVRHIFQDILRSIAS
jgi:hypothetical protein